MCTCGRFTSTFLEDVAKFNKSFIGLTFGLQNLFGFLFVGYRSIKEDEMEMKHPKKGRLMFLVGLILFGTVGFQMHFVIYFFYQCTGDKNEQNALTSCITLLHIIARIIFSIYSKLVIPILDSFSLTYLKERNADEGDYGKERLVGALEWAFASLLIGPLLNKFDFLSLFFYISQVSCLITIWVIFLYMKEQDQIKSSVTLNESISDTADIDSFHDNAYSSSLQLEMCKIKDCINVDASMQTSNDDKSQDRETESSSLRTTKDGEK